MCCIDEAETANERKISGLTESIDEPADIDTFDIKLFFASTRFLIDLEKSKRCVSGLVVSTSHHALADPRGGARDARPPLGVQILSFSCSFWQKCEK